MLNVSYAFLLHRAHYWKDWENDSWFNRVFFAFVSYTIRDRSLQHVVYRLLGFHRWLPRAVEEVTKEQAAVLSPTNSLHLSSKVYRDLHVKKAQNHHFYTITITWKEIDGIYPISTSMGDSAPSSVIYNYIFRVALLQPEQELDM